MSAQTNQIEEGNIEITLTLNIADGSMKRFFAALLEGGFEPLVRSMAQEILDEAKRRKLPIADELEVAMGKR
jgi:hypothetical protein